MNNICKLLNIKYPIFQGAMAWISESNLAAAVSEAGGLGIIAAGNAPGDHVRSEIRKVKEKTDKPFAVNVMLLSPYVEEVVQVILEEKVPVVTTGAGNPAKYMEAFKEIGTKVVPVVPSVALAKRMQKIGADAVIAEGMEAGGHIGKLTTMALVPQVVDAVDIPVIGAGGVGDGRGMAAVFMLGASGAQIGTRFLVANECIIHQNYKNKVLKAKDIDTVITGGITGHPVRVIRNKLTKEFEKMEKEMMAQDNPDLTVINDLGTGALRMAVVEGEVDRGSLMSGQIAGMVKKEQSCQEIIDEVYGQFAELCPNLV